jgi:hypothetical protein
VRTEPRREPTPFGAIEITRGLPPAWAKLSGLPDA